MVITDIDGRIQYLNQSFTRMTGYAREACIGQNPRMLKSGRHDEAFYKRMWDTILAGDVWTGELTNRRKDGSEYVEEMTITPVRNSGGAVTNFIAIKQDVTARRAGEDAQRMLAAIVETSQDAMISHTPAGLITTWNRGAEAIFGYRAEEMIGKPVACLSAAENGGSHRPVHGGSAPGWPDLAVGKCGAGQRRTEDRHLAFGIADPGCVRATDGHGGDRAGHHLSQAERGRPAQQ